MKLTPLTAEQVYTRLSADFKAELDSVKALLVKFDEARQAGNTLVAQDANLLRNQISSMALNLELAKTEISDSARAEINTIRDQLQALDVTGDVDGLKSNIGGISKAINELYLKSQETPGESDSEDPAKYQYLIDEIERLEQLILRKQPQGKWIQQGGGAGGFPLEVQDEGEQIIKSAKCLNFVGDGVSASVDPANRDCVIVDIPSVYRQRFENQTQLVFDDVDGEPIIQVFVDSEVVGRPVLYGDIETLLYGLDGYGSTVTHGISVGWSWEQSRPVYTVVYAAVHRQLTVDFASPQTGTVIIIF